MENGIYKVSFNVDLSDCENEEEARNRIMGMCIELIDEGFFPEVDLELIERADPEYTEEEEEIPELNFEEAV